MLPRLVAKYRAIQHKKSPKHPELIPEHRYTGCHIRVSLDHLHTETQMLTIADSLGLLCQQYLVSALCPTHSSHAIVAAESRPHPQIKKNSKTIILGP